jgi:prepilin-type N-terminal cleavage/methylation domain-containing protein
MKSPHPSFRLPRKSGFTLIELLTVIAVIAILAALTLAIAGYVRDQAARSLAKSQIAMISSALEAYHADNGTFPKQLNGADRLSTKVLLEALSPITPGQKVYDIPLKMMDSFKPELNPAAIRASATYLVDPYGNPYHYQFDGAPNRSGKIFFDLWSQGKSNSNDQNLWIKNW